ncbi:bifunctional (p)ppGpp synthetase/guanosine-3',5'-bis(diphosphate) 3'-pyrophosphohydrolase [bacterium]|nr:bifunctional (p)ppGpp synthetase/guanosine-3',5'-bis(diphosphate) 3'-pyrophosphohydrolase [bacterium]
MQRSPDGRFTAEKAQIMASIGAYHRRWNRQLVENAFDFAVDVHKDQYRQSGEPYFIHPLAVAQILTELKTDYIAVAAGLLHDVVEDAEGGSVSSQDIEEKFGSKVSMLVSGVTKFSEHRFHSYEERQAESIRKMLLSMMKDLRVILIKFADRLHNMRTIDALPRKSQERIALETRDIYAALAHRLGVAKIARELDDLSLRVLDRKTYDEITRRVYGSLEARQAILDEILIPIRRELENLSIHPNVQGRVKSISSIYNKIHKRGKNYDEILDLLAIRIIVQRKAECYQALGLVHELFKPVTEHFTDYIALPKSNLYQSIHTKVLDKHKRIIEVQIRTEEMHALAENGIAAHWRYKEGVYKTDELEEHFAWIRTLMEVHQENAETGEFLESLKIDLFHDEIFVFTPKGKLIPLPSGSTPVDFAFAIHSDIGLHTIGAKVGGKVVTLSAQLESGDTVQILASPKQRPSVEWLKFVRTSRARSRIKRWFRETRFDQAISLGSELIDAEINRLKLKYTNDDINEVAVSFGYVEKDEFFADIGSGVLTIGQVMGKLIPLVAPDKETLISRIVRKVSKDKKGIKVGSFENQVVSIADCCSPLPGDSIIGFQIPGMGIVIHRTDCNNVAQLIDEDRKVVSVDWDVEREDRFKARVQVIGDDRLNLLRDITHAISTLNINIISVKMHMDETLMVGQVVVEVRNLPHLTKMIGKINQIRGIIKAERLDIKSELEAV